MNKLKLSILCITFNQEQFIRQTLESIVMQKTNFEYEALIADDCSTDGTTEIIKEFQFKYPNIITPVFRTKNLGVMKNLIDLFSVTKSEYIALCEGDDYFIDENKLQIQIDFLDQNPNYTLCFHPVNVVFENDEKPSYIFPNIKDFNSFTLDELIIGNFIQTNSIVYRRQEYDNLPANILPLDWYLHIYHAKFGKIGFIDKVMANYRKHAGGIWWGIENAPEKLLKKYGAMHLALYHEIYKLFEDNAEYQKISFGNINYILTRITEIDKNENSFLFNKVISETSHELLELLVTHFYHEYNVTKHLKLRMKNIIFSYFPGWIWLSGRTTVDIIKIIFKKIFKNV
jgi:glycosyltransferase involved in cell wall biosynthesis